VGAQHETASRLVEYSEFQRYKDGYMSGLKIVSDLTKEKGVLTSTINTP